MVRLLSSRTQTARGWPPKLSSLTLKAAWDIRKSLFVRDFLSSLEPSFSRMSSSVVLSRFHPGLRYELRIFIILTNENALPDSNVPIYSAELDIEMMAVFASMDRTSAQFKKLLESSDFDLVNIWTPKTVAPGTGTLFEVVLKL